MAMTSKPYLYLFLTGPNHRHVFGRHTYIANFTRDPATLNIRRDLGGAFMPVLGGVFSGVVPISTVNPLIPATPFNPRLIHNAYIILHFDTTRMGVNAPINAAPMFVGEGQGGFLAPTSISRY